VALRQALCDPIEAAIVTPNAQNFKARTVRAPLPCRNLIGSGRNRNERGDTMARKTIEQRLAELDAQRATLKARLSKQERANDTRRKVLLGALVLHRLEHGRDEISRALPDWLRRELPGFLTRDMDKELFADLIKPPATGGTAS